MNLEKIIADLKNERDRLDRAIALLSADSAAPRKSAPKRATPGRQGHALTRRTQEIVQGDEKTLGRTPQEIRLRLLDRV